jgi:hypothetical protein
MIAAGVCAATQFSRTQDLLLFLLTAIFSGAAFLSLSGRPIKGAIIGFLIGYAILFLMFAHN